MPQSSVLARSAPPIYLVPVAGPLIGPLALQPPAANRQNKSARASLTLGRHESCDLKLPANVETVSRVHCRFRLDDDRWHVTDANSRWGTFLNGVRISADSELPLVDGDLLRIHPWTFSIGSSPKRAGMMSSEDSSASIIRTLDGGGASRIARPPQVLSEDLLALLLEAAASLHDAPDEKTLAERLIDSAARGSGLSNAAVLRPVDVEGRVEVLACRRGPDTAADPASFTFSRSLLSAAAEGRLVELSRGSDAASVSSSIVQMNIQSALCVPLMLGPTPAAFLYLDTRAEASRFAASPPRSPHAAAFCAALGRLAGLALANMKRVGMERRQASLESDLFAAAAAQRWVLPPRVTTVEPFTIVGESRPGRFIGGDFFDLVELGPGRVAVAIGDVCGKGIEASVLMTATQGFLHASLLNHGNNLVAAVTAVNKFLVTRCPANRFVTLAVAVLDANTKQLECVDAGHGYAVLLPDDGPCMALSEEGGPPLGVVEFEYTSQTMPLPASGRFVLVSDGIVEQPIANADPAGERNQFEVAGLLATLCGPESAEHDDVARVFRAVIAHAGTPHLADDATAVCLRWDLGRGTAESSVH